MIRGVADPYSPYSSLIILRLARRYAPGNHSTANPTGTVPAPPSLQPGAIGRRLLPMSDHIYKKIELVGSSTEGVDDAVKNAVAKAAQTVRNMRWFEVGEIRGHIDEQQVAHWQVTVKIGFTLDE